MGVQELCPRQPAVEAAPAKPSPRFSNNNSMAFSVAKFFGFCFCQVFVLTCFCFNAPPPCPWVHLPLFERTLCYRAGPEAPRVSSPEDCARCPYGFMAWDPALPPCLRASCASALAAHGSKFSCCLWCVSCPPVSSTGTGPTMERTGETLWRSLVFGAHVLPDAFAWTHLYLWLLITAVVPLIKHDS